MPGVFITGTDTGIGKTHVSVALLQALAAAGLPATGMKPVASGCEDSADGLRNEDALALIQASRPQPAYATCNPYALRAAVAPHLAAAQQGVSVQLAPLHEAYRALQAQASRVVVEGAGGWCVPLSSSLMQADIPRTLALPVILVVGLRLGCINHAVLSARAIEADGCRLLGWIGNAVEAEQPLRAQNIATLQQLLPVPCLGLLGHATTGMAADHAALAPAVAALRREWAGQESPA